MPYSEDSEAAASTEQRVRRGRAAPRRPQRQRLPGVCHHVLDYAARARGQRRATVPAGAALSPFGGSRLAAGSDLPAPRCGPARPGEGSAESTVKPGRSVRQRRAPTAARRAGARCGRCRPGSAAGKAATAARSPSGGRATLTRRLIHRAQPSK